jgi:hypothetical protein
MQDAGVGFSYYLLRAVSIQPIGTLIPDENISVQVFSDDGVFRGSLRFRLLLGRSFQRLSWRACSGRWHDNRHTLVTELAESGAGDEVIMSIAGHVSRAMLSRYSDVRMEAKRRALDEIHAM